MISVIQNSRSRFVFVSLLVSTIMFVVMLAAGCESVSSSKIRSTGFEEKTLPDGTKTVRQWDTRSESTSPSADGAGRHDVTDGNVSSNWAITLPKLPGSASGYSIFYVAAVVFLAVAAWNAYRLRWTAAAAALGASVASAFIPASIDAVRPFLLGFVVLVAIGGGVWIVLRVRGEKIGLGEFAKLVKEGKYSEAVAALRARSADVNTAFKK